MKCPRRSEGSIPGLPQEDKWESDDTCSYCGSLNPDTLMARIEKGDVEIGPTDKSYKIYVSNVGGDKFKRSYRDCPKGSTCKGPDVLRQYLLCLWFQQTQYALPHDTMDIKQSCV